MAETPDNALSLRSWRVLVPLAGLLGTLLWGISVLVDHARYVRSVDCYVQGKITLVSSPVGGRLLNILRLVLNQQQLLVYNSILTSGPSC